MVATRSKQTGFTIVELLIVIVVIGILAAITTVAYNGVQERAKFATVQADLRAVNTALQVLHAEQGSYPVTGTTTAAGWRYSCATDMASFIDGLSSVAASLPQAPCNAAGTQSDTWLYGSDGVGYKLVHLRPEFSTAIKNSIPVQQRDLRWDHTVGGTWGYWTADWSGV